MGQFLKDTWVLVLMTHSFSKEQVRGQFLKDTRVLVLMTHSFSKEQGGSS